MTDLKIDLADFKKQTKVPPFTAFITGSYAYGTPTEESDLDLVILCSPEDRDKIIEQSGAKEPIHYDNLNLIACYTEQRFLLWKRGTEELKELKDKGIVLNRQQHIDYFNKLFEEAGMSKSEGDSGE